MCVYIYIYIVEDLGTSGETTPQCFEETLPELPGFGSRLRCPPLALSRALGGGMSRGVGIQGLGFRGLGLRVPKPQTSKYIVSGEQAKYNTGASS